ncbi:MAG: inositol monophosphatase, partial [Candidatus Omnitrophica bacterium]|nr:inositol monophosphatase [Candidatus Omnitrophota bacterium]
MKLSDVQLEALRRSAVEAALEAGKSIQAYAGKVKEIQHKDSGSTPASKVVSEADYRSQEIILQRLKPSIREF